MSVWQHSWEGVCLPSAIPLKDSNGNNFETQISQILHNPVQGTNFKNYYFFLDLHNTEIVREKPVKQEAYKG